MFTLRRITKEGVEINNSLGLEYSVILKDSSKEQFDEVTKEWSKEDLTDVYGIITFNYGEVMFPLYKDESYFIMTSDGKTFSNLNKK